MQEINETLFLLINAPATPNAIILAIAKVLADQAIWLAPMALIVGWFRGSERPFRPGKLCVPRDDTSRASVPVPVQGPCVP